jgi:hypothetical protein
MLKSFKSKKLFSEDFARHQLSDKIQTAIVAAFWVGFFAILMVCAAKTPSPSAARNVPSTPYGMSTKSN